MNWLRNLVRPKIRAISGRDIPEDLWIRCNNCSQMIFHSELTANLHVCPHCQHHRRLTASQRLSILFDDKRYEEIPLPKVHSDPLQFRDVKRYSDRLKDAQQKAKRTDGTIVARGTIDDILVVSVCMDFSFLGGSMGMSCGEAILLASQTAIDSKAPLLAICASGGARMQESMLSLVQMPRSVIAINRVKQAGLPYLTLLTDPTTGGVSASFAMLGDVAIAEPGATIGFAGKRVIEETTKQKTPDEFQTAESLMKHGMVDVVTHRKNVKKTIAQVLRIMLKRAPNA
ncbi:MAG: acetyl-CoA carboxylase carboxyltransferase subunit beta [Alphaproteobacteria bacterium GM202ARS2]|nr:acetyl-CoA carboxylase carboxyltransferase subunit beta [Alphaproteobacteria bacterium GM202ARS2]